MKIKKKGFTLIELLTALAIMGIIITIGAYSYISYKKKSDDYLLKIESEQIKIAAISYLRELESSPDYKFYVENGITYSCIRIKTLQEMGYYKGEVDFNNENYVNALVKVTKKNGVATYEIGKKDDLNCSYYKKDSSDPSNKELVFDKVKEGEDEVNLNGELTKVEGYKNEEWYNLRLNFDADVFEKINMTSISVPVYTSIIIDSSGSMGLTNGYGDTRLSSALKAVKAMSNCLVDGCDGMSGFGQNAFVGLTSFGTSATLIDDFYWYCNGNTTMVNDLKEKNGKYYCGDGSLATQNIPVTKIEQITTNGLTNYDDAFLWAFWSLERKNENAIKYVVFLTDGGPTTDDKYRDYINSIKSLSKTTLITVGYSFSNEEYMDMASERKDGNCPDYVEKAGDNSEKKELKQKYCHFDSEATNVESLFRNLSNSIIETTVKEQTIKKSQIILKLSDYFRWYDKNGNLMESKELIIDVPLTDDGKGDFVKKIFDYDIVFDNSKEVSYTLNGSKLVASVDLFKSITFKTYYENGRNPNESNVKKLPKIMITAELYEYIN